MLSLYIDGRRAVIKEGSTITLTLENPFYTDSGEYTYDVTLPLKGCVENQRIFGSLQHPAVSHKFLASRKYPFRLVTELLTLEGKAVVTSVTHEEVTVQLLAGNSALNFDMMGEDGELYIDEMDLGCAWDDWPDYKDGEDSWEPGASITEMKNIFYYWPRPAGTNDDYIEIMMHGIYPRTKCVCFPILSNGDSIRVNPHRVKDPTADKYEAIDIEGTLAPQPYLFDVIQRIFRALGYDIGFANFSGSWLLNIFIANTRSSIRIADLLPKWTVSEFLSEISNFLGVKFMVKGKQVTMYLKNDFYSLDKPQVISQVVDDWSVDISSEKDDTLSSSSNVDYNWKDIDPFIRVPDEVFERAEILKFATRTEIMSYVEKAKLEENLGKIFIADDGTKYALINTATDRNAFAVREIDLMAPKLQNVEQRDIDVELRIVPAQMTIDTYPISRTEPSSFTEGDMDTGRPILVSDDIAVIGESFVVNSAINDEESEEKETTHKETLEVAYWDGNTYFDWSEVVGIDSYPDIHIPVGMPYFRPNSGEKLPEKVKFKDRSISTWAGNEYLDLFKLNSKRSKTIGWLMSEQTNIDTRVCRELTFLDRVFDPTKTFLINGKKYVCQKIEITLDGNGVAPLKRGYFYEIH